MCMVSRSATGPLVDTGVFTGRGERIYLQELVVRDAAECLGLLSSGEDAEKQQLRHELEDVRDELRRLKDAVSTTLRRGGVEDGDGYKLRPKPGDRAVELV